MTAALPLTKLAQTRCLFSVWGRRLDGWPDGGRGRTVAEQTLHNLLECAYPGCLGEDCGHGGHSLAVGFLTLGPPRRPLRSLWLHGIHGSYQDGGGCSRQTALGVEVLRRIGEDLFQAAFGYGDARESGDALDGFWKGPCTAAKTECFWSS